MDKRNGCKDQAAQLICLGPARLTALLRSVSTHSMLPELWTGPAPAPPLKRGSAKLKLGPPQSEKHMTVPCVQGEPPCGLYSAACEPSTWDEVNASA